MLDLLMPYVITLLTQVAGIVGQQLAKPMRRVATQDAAAARADFDYRLDVAQTFPTMMTLGLTAAAFAGHLGPNMTLLTVAASILCPGILVVLLMAHEPQAYASRSVLWGLVSPVSLGVFVVILVLGSAAFVFGGPPR